MALTTKDQWMTQHGFDPSGPPALPPSESDPHYHELHAQRQAWFQEEQRWNQYFTQSGYTPDEAGVKNQPEMGKSMWTGWDQSWKEALGNDPRAQEFQSSPDYKKFLQRYQDPWVAFQNWSYIQSNLNNPKSGGELTRLPGTDLLYTGGPNGTFSSSLNQPMDRRDAIGTRVGPLTFTANGWVDQNGTTVPHPLAYLQALGIGTGGGPDSATMHHYGLSAGPSAPTGSAPGGGGFGAGYTFGSSPSGFSTYSFGEGDPHLPHLPGDTGTPPGTPPPHPPGGSTPGPHYGDPAPPVPGAPGAAGDPGTFTNPTAPYGGPGRPSFNFPGVPQFHPPQFNAPTAESIYADPSFQFRLNTGEKALQASAAARGVLNSGGTLKGVEDYGQNAASQEYGNIFNRALQSYGTQYQAAKDTYAPSFAQWQGLFGAEQQSGMAAFQRAWDQYTFGINDEFRREQLAMTPPPTA